MGMKAKSGESSSGLPTFLDCFLQLQILPRGPFSTLTSHDDSSLGLDLLELTSSMRDLGNTLLIKTKDLA